MKRKYVKGFLCRDATIGSNNNKYWFFKDKPNWSVVWDSWFVDDLSSLTLTWNIKKFKEEYDYNFRLPRMGEKIKCWLEVGDE